MRPVSAKPVPIHYGDRKVFTVAGFNQGISWYLGKLPAVWVEGELAELRQSDSWGQVYLTLKDPDQGATVSATMTRQRFSRLDPPPQAGERVHVLGRAEVWNRSGQLRLAVLELERFGLGLLLRQIEELRRRLAAEGLFASERKRPLPMLPRTIGLVCGTDAAAKRDVVETVTTRYPPARFRIVETVVQGAGAPQRIAAAVRALDAEPEVDVIVLARGGGSMEDLLPFSDELVCRAVAECSTPVVSAIGHEQDMPLVDLAADVRAGTPSLAARLIVPDYAQQAAALDALLGRATRALEGSAGRARRMLQLLAARPVLADPMAWIELRRGSLEASRGSLARLAPARVEREAARVEVAGERLTGSIERRLERETTTVRHAHDRLRLLGPAATLERGYAIVQDTGGHVVRDAAAVRRSERIGVRLGRGSLEATVEEVRG
jgi:exodeoxyribonuclease VII large subunit